MVQCFGPFEEYSRSNDSENDCVCVIQLALKGSILRRKAIVELFATLRQPLEGFFGIHAGKEVVLGICDLGVMPLPRFVLDVFGVVTILLVSVFVVLGLFCIIYSVYFRLLILRQGFLQLEYFNGPWIIRIVLIVVAIWWGIGEFFRLNLLIGEGRLFTSLPLQEGACKFYIIWNIGFAEPSFFLILVSLLHASLQKKECGALSRGWNLRTAGYALLFGLPIYLIQFVLILIEPKLQNKERDMKIQKYLRSTSFLAGDYITCTYPLMNTIVLGFFYCLLICYVSCLGFQMASTVINKGLQRRVYYLIISIVVFLPLRVCLLGFSVLAQPGGLVYEAIVLLAFLMLMLCVLVGIWMLVYHPVADSLALRDLRFLELDEMPVDDYFDGASSLIVNRSHFETGRSSGSSTKSSSISFQTAAKDETTPGFGENGITFSHATLFSSSPMESPSLPGRSMMLIHGGA